jgi:hypothetical protein
MARSKTLLISAFPSAMSQEARGLTWRSSVASGFEVEVFAGLSRLLNAFSCVFTTILRPIAIERVRPAVKPSAQWL